MEFFINALPAILSLIAAFIVCVISFVRDFSTNKFVLIFSIVVIAFYVVGAIVKRILRKQYNEAVEAYEMGLELAAAEEEESEGTEEV